MQQIYVVDFKNQLKNEKYLVLAKINRLAEIFEEKGVENNDIVKFLDVKKETVSRWVNNHQQPSIITFNQIAEYLRVDVRDLFYPSDWGKSKVKPFESKKKGQYDFNLFVITS